IDQTEPDLLSLDPLARFMTGDENSARDMSRVVSNLDRLIQAYGIAVEITHHTGKPSAGDPRRGGQRLPGSSAPVWARDSVQMADRTGGGWMLKFELRHATEPSPMALTRTPALWFRYAGHSAEVAAVAQILKDKPQAYGELIGAIMSSMGVSESTAERRLRE